MLLEAIVDFCDKQYTSFGNRCGQIDGQCSHPAQHCSGSCYDCLYQIHFPDRHEGIKKKLYDCPKMLYHYVCQYSYLYTTELLCALFYEWDYIKEFPYYHVLSIGCGGCADLMALEDLLRRKNVSIPISYIGIDVNELWQPVHDEINKYCNDKVIRFQTSYSDAFDFVKEVRLDDTNIVILSYFISYLYNTEKIRILDSLITDIAEKIIKRKLSDQQLLLVVNDVNSNKRGRDYFSHFEKEIEKTGLSIVDKKYRYFDNERINDFQRVGKPYRVKTCAFDIPEAVKQKYHAQTTVNATVQLIMEVK